MRRYLLAGAVALALSGPALAAESTQYAQRVLVLNPDGSVASPGVDPNNAAFSTPTPFTVGGAAVPVGRSTAAVCTAAGTVTYTMPGGSFNWPVVVGGQIMPFAVTGASAGPACTYTNLN